MSSKGRVLVVEDSPMQRELVAGLLRDEGYDVTEAADGKAGLDQAKSQPPELIFSDIQMPEMNGIDMCRALKSADGTKNIPVVFLSALDNLEDVARGIQAGACDYLSKSADSDYEILAMAKTQVERQRGHEVLRSLALPKPPELPAAYFDNAEIGVVVASLGRQPLYVNAAGRRAITGDETTAIDADRFSRFLSEVAGTCVDQARGAFAKVTWEGRSFQARMDAVFNERHEISAIVVLLGASA